MKDFLKVLALNLVTGLGFILLVTRVINDEFAPAMAYLNYVLVSLLIPGLASSALIKALVLKK